MFELTENILKVHVVQYRANVGHSWDKNKGTSDHKSNITITDITVVWLPMKKQVDRIYFNPLMSRKDNTVANFSLSCMISFTP